MRITRLHIQNFRCIKDLAIELGETTVFIGQNNAGKTAIIDAVRIVLSRRWGQRGTGFTENDVHRPEPDGDPRMLPPVTITLTMEEGKPGEWDADMVAALTEIITIHADGVRNVLTLRVTCAWNPEKEVFDPAWQFLDSAGESLPERRRSINLTGFFGYMPIFWLGALRDAADEFTPRTGHWGRLLRSVRIPAALEAEALKTLADLDAKIIAADPRLTDIATMIGEATRVAVGEGPGSARLNTLPLAMEEMLQRTGIVMRNEDLRPWLPLGFSTEIGVSLWRLYRGVGSAFQCAPPQCSHQNPPFEPFRDVDCLFALMPAFRELVKSAENAGWSAEEVACLIARARQHA